jgi:hypothetical protein
MMLRHCSDFQSNYSQCMSRADRGWDIRPFSSAAPEVSSQRGFVEQLFVVDIFIGFTPQVQFLPN